MIVVLKAIFIAVIGFFAAAIAVFVAEELAQKRARRNREKVGS